MGQRAMIEVKVNGFWSYVHADDEAENGKILEIANDLVEEYKLLSTEDFHLFIDRESLDWGDKWKEAIDGNLSSATCFLPLLTPRFFLSEECRREYNDFVGKAKDLGAEELILQVYYVDDQLLNEEDPSDDLRKIAKEFQWEDWRELRFEDRYSSNYRRAINRMAKRLVEVNLKADATRGIEIARDDCEEEEGSERLGFIDVLADTESSFLEIVETMKMISVDIAKIGETMRDGVVLIKESDSLGRGFRGRVKVNQIVASRLQPDIDSIEQNANSYSSSMHKINNGVLLLLERIVSDKKMESKLSYDVEDFVESLCSLVSAIIDQRESCHLMINNARSIEKGSRDMRPLMKKLRLSMTMINEAGTVGDDWLAFMDNSGLNATPH